MFYVSFFFSFPFVFFFFSFCCFFAQTEITRSKEVWRAEARVLTAVVHDEVSGPRFHERVPVAYTTSSRTTVFSRVSRPTDKAKEARERERERETLSL